MNFYSLYWILFGKKSSSYTGFSLVEMLIVSIILGVLATISVPSWIAFLQRQQLNQMAIEVEMIVRQAQYLAKKTNQTYFIDFQMKNGLPQYSLYGSNTASPPWQSLTAKPNQFTLNLLEGSQIIINHNGSLNELSPIGVGEKVTLSLTGVNSSPQRCVILRTLLGVTEIGKNDQCN